MLTSLDLFSGIGGFALGFQRAGIKTAAFCEIDPFCRDVLRKHWPETPIYEDVISLGWEQLTTDGVVPDIVCGGFPCQGFSLAGKRAHFEDDRSRLFWEMRRIIREIRPRYCVLENVAALRSGGLDVVLGALAEIGYDAEWHCIPAAAFGAPHIRDRIWIIAHRPDADGDQLRPKQGRREPGRAGAAEPGTDGAHRTVAGEVSHTNGARLAQREGVRADDGAQREAPVRGGRRAIPHTDGVALFGPAIARAERRAWWPEPSVGRVADGIPKRVDRLRALGNAVVPDIPEAIGRAILAREAVL